MIDMEIDLDDLVVGFYSIISQPEKLHRHLTVTYFEPYGIKPFAKPNSRIRNWKKGLYVFTKKDFTIIKMFDLPFNRIWSVSLNVKLGQLVAKMYGRRDFNFTILSYDETEN